MSARLPANEKARLARLHNLAVLDSDAEPLFDALAKAAALVTGMPIALVSLIDKDRQWFKANIGLEQSSEIPREFAFCSYTILGEDVLEVRDANNDPRFASNPLVTDNPRIRFYAGAPIALNDGLIMGSLCVIDREPRTLTDTQRHVLRELASAVAEALDQRALLLERNRALKNEAETARRQAERSEQLQAKLSANEAFLDRTGRVAGVGGWEVDLESNQITWSDETCRIHEVPPGHRPSMEEAVGYYAPEARDVIQAAVAKGLAESRPWDLELPLVTAKGRRIWARATGNIEIEDGKPRRLVGSFQDITFRRRAIAALEASDRRFRNLFQYSLGLICTHDVDGILLSVNPAAATSLGYSIADLLGRSLAELMPDSRREGFARYLSRILSSGADSGMLELIAKDGSLRIWQYHNVLDDDGEEQYVLGHAQDITAQQQHERKLTEWSMRDALTGCLNRRFLHDVVASMREEDAWGCIVVDLDRFKLVNDTHGHQRGDEILVAMATFLNTHLRPDDVVIRTGGDEFLMMLKDANAATTEKIVARLYQDQAGAPIGFTLGTAVRARGELLEETIVRADKKLYEQRANRA